MKKDQLMAFFLTIPFKYQHFFFLFSLKTYYHTGVHDSNTGTKISPFFVLGTLRSFENITLYMTHLSLSGLCEKKQKKSKHNQNDSRTEAEIQHSSVHCFQLG